MEFRILGSLEVQGERGAVALDATPVLQELLAVLLLEVNHSVSTGRLAMALGGADAPRKSVKAVQMSVSRLRKALGDEEIIETTRTGYCLRADPDDIDAERFTRLAAEGRAALEHGDAAKAAELLHQALDLWRGDPLDGIEYERFAKVEIDGLKERRLSALEARIEADLALGRHGECIDELRALVAAHPDRERLAAHLMLALYRCGRQSGALEAYLDVRRRLVEESGVEPGPELHHLQEAILRQDPALDLAPAPPAAPVAPVAEPAAPAAEPAAPATEPAADRRVITVVSGRLSSRVDPEAVAPLLEAAANEAAAIVGSHGGRFLAGLDGDMIGMFGMPPAHEDDPLRALRAAEALRALFAAPAHEATLSIAIGVDSGEVIVRGGDVRPVAGGPKSGAARLAARAAEGEVLLTAATRRLVAAAIEDERAQDAWRLLRVVRHSTAVPRRLAAPIVGRDEDVKVLVDAMECAERAGKAHRMTVIGDAGVGKTRLARELAERLNGRVTVLKGRCPMYGDSIGLWPLREALVDAAGAPTRDAIRVLLGDAEDGDRIADMVAAALDLTPERAPADEVPWAFRKLIEAVARTGPVLLIVDDAHWAEPPLLALLDHLVDWLPASPVLMLCLARPDLLSKRPDWAGVSKRVKTYPLDPLEVQESRQLLDNHPSSAAIAERDRNEILRAAEGNPLFIEQIVAMHVDDPDWRAGGAVPPGVERLLAARLDMLAEGEREEITRAAVQGREFGSAAVLAPMPAGARDDLDRLVHRGLLRPLPTADRLTFDHVLICEVASRHTPKARRAELHEEFARWLIRRAGGDDEVIGHHLERAFVLRHELAPRDVAPRELAGEAAEHLVTAGDRALLDGNAQAAATLLERAATLFARAARHRPDVQLELGVALIDTGRFEEAGPRLQAALEGARESGSAVLAARAEIELSRRRLSTSPDAEIEEMLAIADRAIEVFDRAGDDTDRARAFSHRGLLHWGRCECAAADRELRRALDYSLRSGRTRDRQEILGLLARASVLGPWPVQEAIERCEGEFTRAADGDLVVLAVLDAMLAVLAAMRSDIELSRHHYQRSRRRLDGLQQAFQLASLELWFARAELTAGDPAVAEGPLRTAQGMLAGAGEESRLSTAEAYLARVYLAQDKLEQADEFARLAERNSWRRDIGTQVLWRGTRARLHAHDGDLGAAEAYAREAVALSRGTDVIPIHADALTDLAHVLIAADRPAEAGEALDEAIVLHKLKDDVASLAAASALRAAIRPSVAL